MKYPILILFPLLLVACAPQIQHQTIADPEAHEDSLELAAAYEAQAKISMTVPAWRETDIIRAQAQTDAADDPAIWVHPTDRSRSLIFGSNKKGGLAAYNLQGKEVAYYPIGSINNVDVLYDVPHQGEQVTILGCSNRTEQSINLFIVSQDSGQLTPLPGNPWLVDSGQIDDIYGFCLGANREANTYYVCINGKNGMMQQFKMNDGETVALEWVRSIQFDGQTEGMVVDEKFQTLFVGEEEKGIWAMPLDPAEGDSRTFLKNSGAENPAIRFDIEGISLYPVADSGYLVASSQGNFSYAVFNRRAPHAYVGSFKIVDNGRVDGVEETDGLEMIADSLSPEFPKGLLVAQDGFNKEGGVDVPQNFKLVDGKVWLEMIQKAGIQ